VAHWGGGGLGARAGPDGDWRTIRLQLACEPLAGGFPAGSAANASNVQAAALSAAGEDAFATAPAVDPADNLAGQAADNFAAHDTRISTCKAAATGTNYHRAGG
jgi:hypothetical protein